MCGTGMAALSCKIIDLPRFLKPQNFAEPLCHSRRSRKNDVIDAVGLNTEFLQQRRYGVWNDLEKALVPDPAVLQGIVEATGPGSVMIYEVTTDGTMSQAARQQSFTAANQHSRRTVPGLHFQGTGWARFTAVAGDKQRRAGLSAQRISECGGPGTLLAAYVQRVDVFRKVERFPKKCGIFTIGKWQCR